jgi:hypothetical protein
MDPEPANIMMNRKKNFTELWMNCWRNKYFSQRREGAKNTNSLAQICRSQLCQVKTPEMAPIFPAKTQQLSEPGSYPYSFDHPEKIQVNK